MPTVSWVGNSAAVAMIQNLTVTAVALNGVLSVSINGKTISYTCTGADTTTTAAAALQALLAATTAPSEFGEIAFTQAAAIITAAANTPGTPFAGVTGNGLAVSGTGGATITQTTTTANSSPSDVFDKQNWSRAGVASLPQAGDDMVIANSAVPLLWNLDKITVALNSFTRWQSFSAQIGLPVSNPNGYVEWRQTYLALTGPSGTFTMIVGQGETGSGPSRERYNVGGQKTTLIAFASGSAEDDYNIAFLGSHVANALQVTSVSVGVGMAPGETATISTATVDGGGSLSLGSGVTFGGSATFVGATGVINCALSLFANSNSQVIVTALSNIAGSSASSSSTGGSGAQSVTVTPLVFPVVTARDGSSVTWLSDASITTLTMTNGSTLDKSQDVRGIAVATSTIDANCTVNDPNNCITWQKPTTVIGAIRNPPFITGPGRAVQII